MPCSDFLNSLEEKITAHYGSIYLISFTNQILDENFACMIKIITTTRSIHLRFATLCLVLLVFIVACKSDTKSLTADPAFSGETMGTRYNVKYFDEHKRYYQKAIDSLLVAVNQDLSTYISDSHISIFNQEKTTTYEGSPHFDKVFIKAKEIYQKTEGVFDPTVMPLVNYWGFGYTPKKAVTRVDSTQINELMMGVGFDKIIATKQSFYSKQNPRTQLDFSAIAKGYGVDVIAEFLEQKGIENYLVEIGGELRTKGKNPRGDWWLTGINTPTEDASLRDFQAKVMLQNKALATSGNYRNYHEVDGKKYAHTINPKTGYPEANTLLSASIFSDNCMTADAYATACMVMGIDRAFELIDRYAELEGYFIYSDENGDMQVKYTKGIEQYLKK